MKKSVFYSFLMAFAMIFSCTMVASCGDDDPDPAPGGGDTGKTTSGTLYYVEGFNPELFDWVDVQTSVTKADTEANYVTVNKNDLTTLSGVSLPQSALQQFNFQREIARIPDNTICRVVQIAIPSPTTVTYTAQRQFTIKEGYVETEKKDVKVWNTFVFVGNQGSCFVSSFSFTNGQGIIVGKQAEYLQKISANKKSISLKDNNGSIEPATN